MAKKNNGKDKIVYLNEDEVSQIWNDDPGDIIHFDVKNSNHWKKPQANFVEGDYGAELGGPAEEYVG